MRITVVTDETGRIIATLRPAECPGTRPSNLRMHPRDGQRVHHLDLPAELAHLRSLVSLHHTHRVESAGAEPRLVAIQ